MKKIMIVIGLIVLGIVVSYFVAGMSETVLADEERQAKAPGQTISIDQGVIHYLDRGPKDAPVVVMVHGFSTPHFIFEQNAQALTKVGFRVIQFDHFGRGWSDRPKAKYDIEFYDNELIQILDALELDNPIGLVGLSMGGVISTEFVANHPERVAGLFLFVSAGLALSGGSESMMTRMIRTPLLGDWLWRMFARSTLMADPQYDESNIPKANRLQGDVTEQMNYKGYFPALLSSFRHLPMSGRDDAFRRAAQTNIPMMAIFGEQDATIPIESADKLKSLAPNAEVKILPEGTHGLNYQQYEVVNPVLIDFFSNVLK